MNLTIKLLPLNKKNVELLVRLDAEIFLRSDRFSTTDWRKCGLQVYLLRVGRRIVGTVALEHNRDGETYGQVPGHIYLASIGIRPAWQGKGLGLILMSWVISYAKLGGFNKIRSHIRPSNRPSSRLHLRFGFKVLKTVPFLYLDPREEGLLLENNLKGS